MIPRRSRFVRRSPSFTRPSYPPARNLIRTVIPISASVSSASLRAARDGGTGRRATSVRCTAGETRTTNNRGDRSALAGGTIDRDTHAGHHPPAGSRVNHSRARKPEVLPDDGVPLYLCTDDIRARYYRTITLFDTVVYGAPRTCATTVHSLDRTELFSADGRVVAKSPAAVTIVPIRNAGTPVIECRGRRARFPRPTGPSRKVST